MSRYLVIVESPSKSPTIRGYLGSDYQVESCYGHVRDLIKVKGNDIGVDPDNGWQASYGSEAKQKRVIADLKKAAKDVECIYLAMDPDREGEAIAWHLSEVLKAKGNKSTDEESVQRIVFNEITKTAVQKSLEAPRGLNMPLVEAQWSRRYLDRVIGYKISPLLWKKRIQGGSAGRVQSVALRMLVEREREILKFVPREYWQVRALLDLDGQQVEFRLKRFNGKPFEAGSREEIDQHLVTLREHMSSAVISERVDRPLSPRPGAPFITASLQRTASSRLSMDLSRTMRVAQSLYEAGYITYMRTDSTNISSEAVAAVREYIVSSRGPDYLPDQPRRYASNAGAQEGHEAIRPTQVDRDASQLPGKVDDAARRLYDLIHRRFVACQMANAQLLRTRLRVAVGPYEFESEGLVTRFDGFLQTWPEGRGEEKILPPSEEGTKAGCEKLSEERKFTRPPSRFSQANLVRELEKRGIGRPSTYAATSTTLTKRGYVRLEKRRFFVEKMGEMVCSRLEESFPVLMDYDFTAQMEKDLDKVAGGDHDWRNLLDGFYKDFSQWLSSASEEEGMRPLQKSVEVEMPCDKCGRPMALRLGKAGLFLGCTGYSRQKEEDSCSTTINVTPVPRMGDAETEEGQDSEASVLKEPIEALYRQCGKCSSPALPFQIDGARRLWACSNWPDCNWTQLELGNYEPVVGEKAATTQAFEPLHLEDLKCDKYPDDHFILRDSRNGLFLSASRFPKHKESRSIKVAELLPLADKLGEKYQFLLTAPTEDPEGRPTEVRFGRKSKEQYVSTAGLQRGQKGWSAFYDARTDAWKGVEAKPAASGGKKGGKTS